MKLNYKKVKDDATDSAWSSVIVSMITSFICWFCILALDVNAAETASIIIIVIPALTALMNYKKFSMGQNLDNGNFIVLDRKAYFVVKTKRGELKYSKKLYRTLDETLMKNYRKEDVTQ